MSGRCAVYPHSDKKSSNDAVNSEDLHDQDADVPDHDISSSAEENRGRVK